MITLRAVWNRHPKRVIAAGGLVLTLGFLVWLVSATSTAPIDSYAACAFEGYPITDTNPPLCSDGAHTYLGPPAPIRPSQPPVTTQPFVLLVDGDSGGAYPAGQQIISNQAAWESYWRTVHASLATLPPILSVNFATSDVIALSEGRQQTNGYVLEVTDISTSTAGSVVHVNVSIPTVTCTVANVVTNRYFIVSTAKLTTPVTFQTNTTYRQCQ